MKQEDVPRQRVSVRHAVLVVMGVFYAFYCCRRQAYRAARRLTICPGWTTATRAPLQGVDLRTRELIVDSHGSARGLNVVNGVTQGHRLALW